MIYIFIKMINSGGLNVVARLHFRINNTSFIYLSMFIRGSLVIIERSFFPLEFVIFMEKTCSKFPSLYNISAECLPNVVLIVIAMDKKVSFRNPVTSCSLAKIAKLFRMRWQIAEFKQNTKILRIIHFIIF